MKANKSKTVWRVEMRDEDRENYERIVTADTGREAARLAIKMIDRDLKNNTAYVTKVEFLAELDN